MRRWRSSRSRSTRQQQLDLAAKFLARLLARLSCRATIINGSCRDGFRRPAACASARSSTRRARGVVVELDARARCRRSSSRATASCSTKGIPIRTSKGAGIYEVRDRRRTAGDAATRCELVFGEGALNLAAHRAGRDRVADRRSRRCAGGWSRSFNRERVAARDADRRFTPRGRVGGPLDARSSRRRPDIRRRPSGQARCSWRRKHPLSVESRSANNSAGSGDTPFDARRR